MVLGIDGCKTGWVAIALDHGGSYAGAATAGSLQEIFCKFPGFRIAGVDMPLGLEDGRRPADCEARRMLGPARGRSVFPAPPAFVIGDDWIDAPVVEVNAECRRRLGFGVSAQSLALRAKIRELDDARGAGHPVIEVHPELSFAAMGELGPITLSKKTYGGVMERLQRLGRAGIRITTADPEVQGLPADDVLDAAAAAWSAWRFERGKATRVPPGEPAGSIAAIWF
jgi:predicted RNase H-like nuclease